MPRRPQRGFWWVDGLACGAGRAGGRGSASERYGGGGRRRVWQWPPLPQYMGAFFVVTSPAGYVTRSAAANSTTRANSTKRTLDTIPTPPNTQMTVSLLLLSARTPPTNAPTPTPPINPTIGSIPNRDVLYSMSLHLPNSGDVCGSLALETHETGEAPSNPVSAIVLRQRASDARKRLRFLPPFHWSR